MKGALLKKSKIAAPVVPVIKTYKKGTLCLLFFFLHQR
jgi:hypothetical protein